MAPAVLYVRLIGEVSSIKLLMLDNRVPKNSQDPADFSTGDTVMVEYKSVFNHLISIHGV